MLEKEIGEEIGELSNGVGKSVSYIVESYVNGSSWCRVYSDGWCEQGGQISINGNASSTVTFLKPFTNTNYYAIAFILYDSMGADEYWGRGKTYTTTNMTVVNGHAGVATFLWQAKGYIA